MRSGNQRGKSRIASTLWRWSTATRQFRDSYAEELPNGRHLQTRKGQQDLSGP
jgi:hypothetical protein